jgi:hypothetical protein
LHRIKYINNVCKELRESVSEIYDSLFETDRNEIISSIQALIDKANKLLNQIKQDEI